MTLGRRSWWAHLSKTDKWAVGVSVCVAILLIAAGITLGPTLWSTPDTVQSDGCLRDQLSAHTLVIFDRTDPLTLSQARSVLAIMDVVKNDLNVGEKLSVHEVDPGQVGGLSDPLFSLCKPREGSSAHRAYENERFIEEKYQKKFGKPLEDVLREAIEGGGAKRSPIAETLFDVSIVPDFSNRKVKRRLLIFSDLMQHSAAWSQYGAQQTYQDTMKNPTAKSLMPDLTGVDTMIYYLLRYKDDGSPLQSPLHITFWEQYLTVATGIAPQIKKIR